MGENKPDEQVIHLLGDLEHPAAHRVDDRVKS